jgi:hypothetical protein
MHGIACGLTSEEGLWRRRTAASEPQHLEDGTRAQCHPLADLALLVDIHPGFAIVGIPIAEASQRLLLAQEPLDSSLDMCSQLVMSLLSFLECFIHASTLVNSRLV